MELDDTLARVKHLIQQREKIDKELNELLNVGAKRGRPRKAEQPAETPAEQ
ncbi:hypothetical protein [Bradyrhizobium elkanii]|uniref:hypothetical protein n=1 Tax=Bradyrhizobium elkanii TaxID=29448 RepID=UPI003D216430